MFNQVRYMLSPFRLSSVCSLSVCNVDEPYSAGWNFRQFFFGVCITLAIRWHALKILRRSSEGNPSVGGFKRKRCSEIYSDFWHLECYNSEKVQDRR